MPEKVAGPDRDRDPEVFDSVLSFLNERDSTKVT